MQSIARSSRYLIHFISFSLHKFVKRCICGRVHEPFSLFHIPADCLANGHRSHLIFFFIKDFHFRSTDFLTQFFFLHFSFARNVRRNRMAKWCYNCAVQINVSRTKRLSWPAPVSSSFFFRLNFILYTIRYIQCPYMWSLCRSMWERKVFADPNIVVYIINVHCSLSSVRW